MPKTDSQLTRGNQVNQYFSRFSLQTPNENAAAPMKYERYGIKQCKRRGRNLLAVHLKADGVVVDTIVLGAIGDVYRYRLWT